MATTKIDLGCGVKPREGYTGIDINKKYSPHMVWDMDDPDGLPFYSEQIGSIWMGNSLEHVKDPFWVLKECYRILRKSGEIEIICPNVQWFPLLILGWFIDIHKFWNWWMSLPFKKSRGLHYSIWTPYTLQIALENIGFTIVKIEGSYLSKQFYIKAVK